MRVTTNGMMRRYNKQLNTVMYNMNIANQKVQTGRKFLKGSEAPADATKARNLIRQYEKNKDYLTNLRDTIGLYDVMESSMMSVSKLAEESYVELLAAINGTMTPQDREIFAAKLREVQETIVMQCNAEYGDQYVFGGSSAKGLPFKLENGVLTFRGVDVNDPAQAAVLDQLAGEKLYTDVGLGMTMDPGSPNVVVPGSAFNTAIPGITFLGYGVDSNGLSNNLVVNLGKIADALEKDPLDRTEIQELGSKLDEQRKHVLISVTQLGTDTNFLEFAVDRLENNQYNLETSIDRVVFGDPEKLITDFQMQQYVYNAALKMGTTILSPSFIDFMR